MTKGTTASRAVLVIIGAMMAITAIGAGIQPLMGIIGFADQSSDVEMLQDLETAVREKCAEAENNEAIYRTELTADFSSLDQLKVEGGNSLVATFTDSQDEWDSRVYDDCSLKLDAEGQESIGSGEWTFNVTGSSTGENPEVTIEAEQ